MTIGATQIVDSFNPATHDLSSRAVEVLPDGTQQPVTLQTPGYRYDLWVEVLPAFASPAVLANGTGSLALSDVSAWISAAPQGTTVAQLVAWIASHAGAITPDDVGRAVALVAMLSSATAPPSTPPVIQTTDAPDITLS